MNTFLFNIMLRIMHQYIQYFLMLMMKFDRYKEPGIINTIIKTRFICVVEYYLC